MPASNAGNACCLDVVHNYCDVRGARTTQYNKVHMYLHSVCLHLSMLQPNLSAWCVGIYYHKHRQGLLLNHDVPRTTVSYMFFVMDCIVNN